MTPRPAKSGVKMSASPQNPFDGRFFVAILAVMLMWVGWQSYLAKKYPKSDLKNKENIENIDSGAVEKTANQTENSGLPKNLPQNIPPATSEIQGTFRTEEKRIAFDYKDWSFQITNHGMALKNITLKNYTDRSDQPVVLADESLPASFGTFLLNRPQPVVFNMNKTTETELVGVATIDGMKITKIMNMNPDTYTVTTRLSIENPTDAFAGITTRIYDWANTFGGAHIPFMPEQNIYDSFVKYENTDERNVVVNDPDKAISKKYVSVHMASFGSAYFSTTFLDESPIFPSAVVRTENFNKEQPVILSADINHEILNRSEPFNIKYTSFTGPKSYELLKSIGPEIAATVNFGFFRSLGLGIYWLMKSIYGFVGNWGMAILILTFIVRLLVLPLNFYGFRQMKALQKIQPEMQLIREKYKNDAQKSQQEIMRVMKEHKANPISGCLPMFLQIPIFFALFGVIGHSIELYKAPFAFWITDLSLKDPYYVLPVLISATMFLQQKTTPSTLPPEQQKIMLFMPLIFMVFMIGMPSGLALYMFISTLFSVLQQIYFLRNEDRKAVKA